MATIDSKEIVDELIANNGNYEDDPPVMKIVKYTNAWGGTGYGLIHKGQPLDMYRETAFVRNPETIFERKA